MTPREWTGRVCRRLNRGLCWEKREWRLKRRKGAGGRWGGSGCRGGWFAGD